MIGKNAQDLKIDGPYMIALGKEAGRIMLAQMSNYLGESSAVLFRHQDLRHHYWPGRITWLPGDIGCGDVVGTLGAR